MATGNGLYGLLQASDLEGKANDIQNIYNNYENETLPQIRGLIHGLDAVWKGRSEEALVQRFDSEQPSFTSLGQTIQDYATEARKAAEDARNRNSSLAALIRKALFSFFSR